VLAPLRELRHSLSELRIEKLAVGSDGRNRTMLSPFGASSGRNTPSANKFVFWPSVWLRGLIKPGPDKAIAYIDWSSQEVAIAAASLRLRRCCGRWRERIRCSRLAVEISRCGTAAWLHEHGLRLETQRDQQYPTYRAPQLLYAIPRRCDSAHRRCLATERGAAVCAPVHDALPIEAPFEQIDDGLRHAAPWPRPLQLCSGLESDRYRC
jgi:hypothetical protein